MSESEQSLLKLLVDKKVADAYQYYKASEYKLYLAGISVQALDKIISNYKASGASAANKFYQDALEKGVGKFMGQTFNAVNFCGINIPVDVAMTKLTMEVMSILHNFFDTFAQWINLALFGEDALDTKSVSIGRVAIKSKEFTEYTGQFIIDLQSITDKNNPTVYQYISDFNNLVKHRAQIHVMNSINLINAEGSVAIPKFSKDDNTHTQIEVNDIIHEGLDYCKKLLSDSRQFVEDFYSGADNKHVEHRIYNPKVCLLFASYEDRIHMRNPQNHYAFVEVDPANIATEYDIMICRDTMEQQDGSIEIFNSPYDILMMRESGTSKIIGIMKPEDGETYKLKDEHMLIYRKYTPQTSGYEFEMFNSVCNGGFKFYPLVADNEIIILNEDNEKEGEK